MAWIASLTRPFDGAIVTEREISPGVVVNVRQLPALFGIGARIREMMSTIVFGAQTRRIVIL
jgi:hypothetical protein